MSVELMTWAWSLKLPAMDKFVLLTLSDHASNDSHACWPGAQRLADLTGYSKSGIYKTLRRLRDRGLIETSTRWRDHGGHSSNMYVINLTGKGGSTTGHPPLVPQDTPPYPDVPPIEPLRRNPKKEKKEKKPSKEKTGLFSLNKNGTSEWSLILTERLTAFSKTPLTKKEIRQIEDDYPRIDLIQQAKLFAAWHDEHGSPTIKGRVRALHNWLSRAKPEPVDGIPIDWGGKKIGAGL